MLVISILYNHLGAIFKMGAQFNACDQATSGTQSLSGEKYIIRKLNENCFAELLTWV
jgi:hypothetical protein